MEVFLQPELNFYYLSDMKKVKIDPKKVIKVKPKTVEEGPDVGLLFVMILGFLVGMIIVSIIS